MDTEKTRDLTWKTWDESILPQLADYVRIPNKSPVFDPEWEAHGHMEAAIQLMKRWADAQEIKGMKSEILRIAGRTPVLYLDIPGSVDDCVLLYGHLDKQPEFTGWSEGLDPWTPVFRDGKLYGRGGADDGYAVFASLTAIRALQAQGVAHARCIVLIEASEESGSPDLAAAHRRAGRSPRHTEPRRLSRRRVRQLRAAVEHDVAARQPHRDAAGGRADRRRALGIGERRRAVELSCAARSARAYRGRAFGRIAGGGTQRAGSVGPPCTGQGGCSRPRRRPCMQNFR